MSTSEQVEVATAFIEAINHQDLEELSFLLAEDHRLVDSLGTIITGHEAVMNAWSQYFKVFPDYQITIDQMLEAGPQVAIFGRARGTLLVGGKREPQNRWNILGAETQ